MPIAESLSRPNTPSRREERTELFLNLFLTLSFITLFLIHLTHHQMWRDELNAWGLSASSPDLHALYHYVHYEGHPSLWYVLLWFGSHWTHSPLAMKYVEAAIGIGIYLMIGLWSPFSIPEKTLIFLSYYIAFEYTVISRMYGLCLLIALIYAAIRVHKPRHIFVLASLLGIMANTDMLGMILSGACLLEYVAGVIYPDWSYWKERKKQITKAACLYVVLIGVSVLSLWPAKDIGHYYSGHMFAHARDLMHLKYIIAGFLTVVWFPPISRFGYNFSWVSWVSPLYIRWFSRIMTPLVLISIYLIFRKQRSLMLLGSATIAGILFFHFIFAYAYLRHFGLTFMAFLVAIWILRANIPALPVPALFLLGLSALAGMIALYGQWKYPFSNAGAAAKWIQSHGLQNTALIGANMSVTGVAEELSHPIYFLECNCPDTFFLFSNRMDKFPDEEMPQRILVAMHQVSAHDAVFVLDRPLTQAESNTLRRNSISVTELSAFTGAAVWDEDFFLYRLAMDG